MDNATLIAAAGRAVDKAGSGYVYNPEPGGTCQYTPDDKHPYGCIVNAILEELDSAVRAEYASALTSNIMPGEWQHSNMDEDDDPSPSRFTWRQCSALGAAQSAQDGMWTVSGPGQPTYTKTWTRPPQEWTECLSVLEDELT